MKTTFFELLWPEAPDAYVSTWLKKSGATRFFHTSQPVELQTYLADASRSDDAYFGVGLLAKPATKGRGTVADVAYISAFWMDFDIAAEDGNVHAQASLPRTVEELDEFLEDEAIFAPTMKVHSGNGLHAYWRLDQILDVRTPEARSRARVDSSNFQRAIIGTASEKRGWKLDNTADLARVLRWPGTLNHKTNPPKHVEIIP